MQSVRKRLWTSTILAGVAALGAPAITLTAATGLPTAAVAQESAGNLGGTVTDSAGAAVAGARVTVTSNEQGFSRQLTTDAQGRFRVPLIPLGTYTVAVENAGFESLSDDAVRVGSGAESNFAFTLLAEGEVSEVVVTASARPQIDFSSTTAGVTLDVEELIEQVPVARNVTALALLAPGAVPADTAFAVASGGLIAPPSISGASGGENAFFINGLNITNFQNGIGGGTVPFDFYRSVDIQTGGIPAEFGRFTGGVINAVSKSGSNDFRFAVRGNYSPDGLREQSPDTLGAVNSLGTLESSDITLEAGGPIIRDRLFFFALAQFSELEQESFTTGGTYLEDVRNDPFYAFKLDANITDRQRLELTYFDTTQERDRTARSFNPDTGVINPKVNSITRLFLGGENYIGRYTGTFTDWLTVSAAYGRSENDASARGNLAGVPLVQDTRISPTVLRGTQTAAATTFPTLQEREFYRADVDLFFNLFGSHHVRAGFDQENTTFTQFSVRNGGGNFIYARAGATSTLGLAPGQETIQRRNFVSGGAYEGTNKAYYIQDEWELTDDLSIQVGFREDQFEVISAGGQPFLVFPQERAVRIGATYDPLGNGRDKIFGYYGRFYLPVVSNTAFRSASPATDISEFFRPVGGGLTFGALDPVTGLPVAGLGPQVTQATGATSLTACPAGTGSIAAAGTIACVVRNNGREPAVNGIIAQGLKSTYEDEFRIGYTRSFDRLWSGTAQFTYRNLGRVSEDANLDQAVINYCARNAIAGCEAAFRGSFTYRIINPGEDNTITLTDPAHQLPGGGSQTITLTAADIAYPKAEREYIALELSFERAFDGVYSLAGSYVGSRSQGNFEGALKSDNGQVDPGITSDFDFQAFIPGQFGLLPNHRGHVFKLYGGYQVLDGLLIGGNLSVISPRKYGCIGSAPDVGDGPDANDSYGVDSARYCLGSVLGRGGPNERILVDRGSEFESDWITRLDMSARYNVPKRFSGVGDLVFRVDVFNILNLEGLAEANEFGELSPGDPDPDYKGPIAYQAPRSVRFGFDFEF